MNNPILAVETANNRTSIALQVDGSICFHAVCPVRDNIGWLREQVTLALGEKKLRIEDLGALAVTHGPGGMTGVRVGVGFVQGLALASHIPVIAVNTLSVMAFAARGHIHNGEGGLSVALDARMDEIYVADGLLSDSDCDWLNLNDRVTTTEAEIARHGLRYLAGPGWDKVLDKDLPLGIQRIPKVIPDAADLAALAAFAEPQDARVVQVHYLRQKVAEVPARLRAN